MKYLKPKDIRHRIAFIRLEKRRLLLKALASSSFIPPRSRFAAQVTLLNLRKYGLPTKIRNRCINSARSNSVDRKSRLARSRFNLFAGAGLLPGIRKSSW